MCDSCEALMINGVYCHETGCPDSHLDANGNLYKKECQWCGSVFTPEDKDQEFCDSSCYAAYHGFDCLDAEEEALQDHYFQDSLA